MSIYKVKIKCEVVTPLFLYGADGKKSELRISSIKGLLRFWWRAINHHLSIEELRKKEFLIFGGVSEDDKNKTVKSKVSIRMLDKHLTTLDFSKELNKNDYSGIYYLLYSVIDLNKKEAINTGDCFEIEFKTTQKEFLEEYLKALLFLQFFGGLGTRNRRGAGSIRIIELKGYDEFNYIKYKGLFYTDSINSKEELIKRFKELSSLVNNKAKENSYSVVKGSKVIIFDSKKTWQEALNFIGEKFKKFRADIYKSNNKNKIYIAANFGFPIIHKKKVKIIAGKINKKNELVKINRKSSSIIFKVIKIKSNEFYPVLIHLNGDLILKEYKFITSNIKKQDFTNVPNVTNEVIDNFIEEIKIGENYVNLIM